MFRFSAIFDLSVLFGVDCVVSCMIFKDVSISGMSRNVLLRLSLFIGRSQVVVSLSFGGGGYPVVKFALKSIINTVSGCAFLKFYAWSRGYFFLGYPPQNKANCSKRSKSNEKNTEMRIRRF